MPSLDRVGRYYPLSIVARLCSKASPFDIATSATGWFEDMEARALSCLREDFDFPTFDAELSAAPLPSAAAGTAAPSEAPCPEIQRVREIGSLLSALLERTVVGYSLWWTSGSPTFDACLRSYQGLPPTEEFGRLLG